MLSFFIWSWLSLIALPQNLVQQEMIKLQKQSPNLKVVMSDTQELSLITNLHLTLQGNSVNEKASFFLKQYAGLFPSMLTLKQEENTTTKNRTIVEMTPMLNQKPVFNQALKLSFDQNQALLHVSSNLTRFQQSTEPTIHQAQALKKLQDHLSLPTLQASVKEGYLIQQKVARAVYQFSIPHPDFAQQKVAYIDAVTGEIMLIQKRVWR